MANAIADVLPAENHHHSYEVAADIQALAEHRWIGRCKTCRATHKLEGRVVTARHARTGHAHSVMLSTDDRVYTFADLGTNPYRIVVRCGDHWIRLNRVTEGRKRSKHECNARCLASTGPNCDCKCRGANHGSSL